MIAYLKGEDRFGQGMVEFALALPILLLLVMGIIEGARLLFIYAIVSSASREGARYAVGVGTNNTGIPQYDDCANIRAAAKRIGSIAGIGDSNIQIYKLSSTNVATAYCPNNAPSTMPFGRGDRVQVKVTISYRPIVPLVPFPSGLPIVSANARSVISDVYIQASEQPNVVFTTTVPPSPTPNPSTPTPTQKVPPGQATNTPTPTTTPTPTIPLCSESGIITGAITQGDKNWEPHAYKVQIINTTPNDGTGITGHLISLTAQWQTNSYLQSIYFASALIASPNSGNPVIATWPSDAPNNVLGPGITKMLALDFSGNYVTGNSAFNVTLIFALTSPSVPQCRIELP